MVNLSSLPNLVILFADNLGYDDVSLFQSSSTSSSSRSRTPHIDSLGNEGLQFTNWNSAAALCSASRSALLTGKYPVKTGTYPRVFKPDAVYGLLPEEVTLAELLQVEGYATSIVGKWHLGHRPAYLPTNQGFEEWTGIPYHMSGGSVDGHECATTIHNETLWLPLYRNETIVEQPVRLDTLADTYVHASVDFIERHVDTPFFLYMAFSHVHQLCAPQYQPEQGTCQWADTAPRRSRDHHSTSHNHHSKQRQQHSTKQATFDDAVQEMDWITGEILRSLDEQGIANNTLVLFTSDNGPWVAEQACAGSKGPFKGEWLQRNLVDSNCTACPHDYVPSPSATQPRRCVLPGDTDLEVQGVPCGDDTGLGSVWEANLRMPALVRFPGRVPAGETTNQMVSTLDVIPTFLSLIDKPFPADLDGMDVSDIWLGREDDKVGRESNDERVLFFWRDGFQNGTLPAPYGRFDVAAVKLGRIKAWFWTKSAHYNDDIEVYHDPPLLFDVLDDPAESLPLDATDYQTTIDKIIQLTAAHKASLDWTRPLALATDPKYLPCADPFNQCRTHSPETNSAVG